MGGDTGLLNPGDRVGGNIADDEASVIEDIRRVDTLPLPHEKPV